LKLLILEIKPVTLTMVLTLGSLNISQQIWKKLGRRKWLSLTAVYFIEFGDDFDEASL